jgi:hypothetical protein
MGPIDGSVWSPKVANYVGQLRLYSYVDLVLLWLWLGRDARSILAGTLLWFGFLVHLEWRHRDRGRLLWPWWAWAALIVSGAILAWSVWTFAFAALSALYAYKKRFPRIARFSFVYNGLLKVALLLATAPTSAPRACFVWVVMALRDLAGDFRDVEKDAEEGVETLPVWLGLRRDRRWLYPAALAVTSALWATLGHVQVVVLVACWAVQVSTYRLTPR